MNRLLASILATAFFFSGCSDPVRTDADSVTLDAPLLALLAGEHATLTATVLPGHADNKRLAWSSSDKAVATVDASGGITAVAAGRAAITAQSHNGKTVSCEVAVAGAVLHEGSTGALTWKLFDNGMLGIRGSGAMPDYEYSHESPSHNTPWYGHRELITGIAISPGITTVGGSAFCNCAQATSAAIPESVTGIGRFAFTDCGALTGITIPDGITSVEHGTFYACSALADIHIPGSVTRIGESAFSGCRALTNIVLPDGVTTIGECAFWYCGSLTSVVIPSSVTSIGRQAFFHCRNLKEIAIPDGITKIEKDTFDSCAALRSITIPGSVTISIPGLSTIAPI